VKEKDQEISHKMVMESVRLSKAKEDLKK